MSRPATSPLPSASGASASSEEAASFAPWLEVVCEKVKSMRFGVVQIVIHDSKVVQIERTERTRFDIPQATSRR